ncbi:MAG: histidinol dehydrogenase [Pseudomonadota bacterium]|nr:histidinol dehydrogenase [Pseudomonadota bacterium]
MTQIQRLDSQAPDFRSRLHALLAFETAQDPQVDHAVQAILADVKQRGDAAVLEYTCRFDKSTATSLNQLEMSQATLKAAYDTLPEREKNALTQAAQRVRSYHERQKQQSWQYTDEDGTLLGQKITPLDRIGIYVPGGKAAYPSSVLMNAMPAQVAGVEEIIMVSPARGGDEQQLVLAAAYLAGVHRVFSIGGAQAVAALAYGTETIPQVDKIVGPGNAYVAAAKRHVFGVVGIDMVAGPSEILVICDGSTDPDWIAMDLFSQAEHDEIAQSILLCPDQAFIDQVQASIDKLLPQMPRREIIAASLANRGALIKVGSMDEACDIANFIAPEHLELSVAQPHDWLPKLRHAGAIFMGRFTSESLGDYCAGPNHVLPTSRTARFASPLGVYDFQKRTSLIEVSAAGAVSLGKIASVLAHGEGLQAHARSAELRLESQQ